jgi:hypothetical protein
LTELATARYEVFLSGLDIEVAPLVQEDAVVAANKQPSREVSGYTHSRNG